MGWVGGCGDFGAFGWLCVVLMYSGGVWVFLGVFVVCGLV